MTHSPTRHFESRHTLCLPMVLLGGWIAIGVCAFSCPRVVRAVDVPPAETFSDAGPIAEVDRYDDSPLNLSTQFVGPPPLEDSSDPVLSPDAQLASEPELIEHGVPALPHSDAEHEGPQFEFWVISSRDVQHSDPMQSHTPQLRFIRYDGLTQHQEADLAEFLSGFDHSIPTIVYVHGNRVESVDAEVVGRRVLKLLSSYGTADGKHRFVLWSWPSGRFARFVKDARVKAHRSDVHGYYLAWLIDQCPRDVPLSLLGYSYGARLISGALHLLGGGSLVGRELPLRDYQQPMRVRATFLAAALDNHWLLPGRRHGRALSQVQRLLVLKNSRDPVLKRYPWLDPRHSSKALGYTGLFAPWRIGPDRAKINQIDVTHSVGLAHDEMRYLQSIALRTHLNEYVFFEDEQAPRSRSPSG